MRSILKNPAVFGTVVVSIGTFIGSIFAYLLQLLLGRRLSVADFGIFNALLSLFTLLTVFSGAVTTSLIKLVSKLKAEGKFDILTHLFKGLTIIALGLGFVVSVTAFLAHDYLGSFFHITDKSVMYSFALYLGSTFIAILPSAYLQGLLRFKAFAFWSVANGFFRFIIPSILLYLGYKVGGVYVGMTGAIFASYLLVLLLLKKNFEFSEPAVLKSFYKQILFFAVPVLFIQLGLTLLSNIDVIMVKHYFDENTAGLYSGVVTIGKVFLFGASTVVVVMFPQVSEAYARNGNYLEKFKQFFLLQVLILFLGFLVFNLFPSTIAGLMFGEKFLPSVVYVPKFSVFIALYVMVSFMIMFLLAVEKTRLVWIVVPGVLAQLVLITLFHSTLNEIINVNILISASLFLSLVLYSLKLFSIRSLAGVSHTSS